MIPTLARILGMTFLCALWVGPLAAQKWTTQFFYDKDKSRFEITDLQFPSATRGVAVGAIEDGKRRDGMSYVTSDGGATWNPLALREIPLSVFFLNENVGWLVTTKGLWQTAEAGKSWRKLPHSPGQIYRVFFLNEKDGWAVGPKKTALETHDGGAKWLPVAVAADQPGEPNYSAYTWVAFANAKFGVISGWNIPPRRFAPERPEWVDPEATLHMRETPHLSYLLSTGDGGKTWKPSAASLFGTVSKIRLRQNGDGLGLIEYAESFRYPSEAYFIDWATGRNRTVYRDAKFAVSDVWLASDGTAYLSGNLVQGQLRSVIPGKVQVMSSKDLQVWKTMDVDYRASALRTMLAAPDDQNIWMATNTGMILKLVR